MDNLDAREQTFIQLMHARAVFALYALFCFGLTLAAAEYVLRRVYRSESVEPVYKFDRQAIAAPREHFAHLTSEGWWRTNSLGARGEELDLGAESIIVFGDSNIAARFAAESATFPVRLAALTSSQVANFGVPGYGPDQSVARLEALLASSKFNRLRAVILHIFADNDLGDLIRNALPRFGMRKNMGPWRDPTFSFLGNAASHFLIVRKMRDRVLRSRFETWLYPDEYYPPPAPTIYQPSPNMIERLVTEQLRSFTEYRKGGFSAWYADYYDAAIALDVDPELIKEALIILARVFRTFTDLSHSYGFCPLILVQPSEIDVANTYYISADDMFAFARRHGYSYYPQRLTRLIEQAAREAALPVLSLFNAFEAKAFYYSNAEKPGDNHWNPAGMEEAARLAARHLAQACPKN